MAKTQLYPSYEYDKAGNITGLNRYGLIDASAGQYTYGLIDSLDYIYANGDSRLSSIEDFVADPLAELQISPQTQKKAPEENPPWSLFHFAKRKS